MKIRKFEIQDYKIFKKINIDFTDKDDNSLPIIIIAGINGTGKTTILEYLYNSDNYYFREFNQDKMEFEYDGKIIELPSMTFEWREYFKDIIKGNFKGHSVQKIIEEKVIYIPANKGLEDIKNLMPLYIENMIYKEDARASEIHQRVRDNINNIFKDLNLSIEFDSRNGKGDLFFRNKKGEKLSIDDLSTGEKTLISKILYLYIKEIKNSVILIDEPELSLHPKWQNQVLKLYENFAKENNCQIIIATHSPHIIGSAKNEYIRVLTEDGVINDVLAYGRDIEWVLEEVMGASYTREHTISKKIKACQGLLEEDKYDEVEKCIDEIESVIGKDDREIMALRNSLEFWRD